MSDGVAQAAGRGIGRARASIDIDRSDCLPFAVAQFDAIVTSAPDLELVWRKHLLRQSPRLATEKAGIVGWIERIRFERSLGQSGTQVVIRLVLLRLRRELREWARVIFRIVEQRVESLDRRVSAREEAQGANGGRRWIAPHAFPLRRPRLWVGGRGGGRGGTPTRH